MRINVVDLTGKVVGEVELHEQLFNAPINDPLVAQAIRVRLINAKAGTASVQTRTEVRGGGRKPWKQKGTGRARHGSIRSPLWKGGGVVHGPVPYKANLSLPQTMRRAALFSVLTAKAKAGEVLVLDNLTMDVAKSKVIAQMLQALGVQRSALMVLPERMLEVERSAKNVRVVTTIHARVLHPYELLNSKTIIFLRDSLGIMEQMFVSTGEPTMPKRVKKSTSAKANVGSAKTSGTKKTRTAVKEEK